MVNPDRDDSVEPRVDKALTPRLSNTSPSGFTQFRNLHSAIRIRLVN